MLPFEFRFGRSMSNVAKDAHLILIIGMAYVHQEDGTGRVHVVGSEGACQPLLRVAGEVFEKPRKYTENGWHIYARDDYLPGFKVCFFSVSYWFS